MDKAAGFGQKADLKCELSPRLLVPGASYQCAGPGLSCAKENGDGIREELYICHLRQCHPPQRAGVRLSRALPGSVVKELRDNLQHWEGKVTAGLQMRGEALCVKKPLAAAWV